MLEGKRVTRKYLTLAVSFTCLCFTLRNTYALNLTTNKCIMSHFTIKIFYVVSSFSAPEFYILIS